MQVPALSIMVAILQYVPDAQCDFITIQISENGTTYFIHSFEQGLLAAMNVSDGSKLYYEFDSDG